MKTLTIVQLFVVLSILLVMQIASADIIWNFDSNTNKLRGAQNIPVGNVLYDASFIDGTITSIFGANPIFTFKTPDESYAAAKSLLDNVLIDFPAPNMHFNSDPNLIQGLSFPSNMPYYYLIIPNYIISPLLYSTGVVYVTNQPPYPFTTTTTPFTTYAEWDLSEIDQMVYVVWTPSQSPVPVPPSMLLLGSGLVGIILERRRRVKTNQKIKV